MDTKHKLEVLQKELGSNPTNPSTLSQERDLYRLYLSLVRAEESLAKQKSRIQWLKLGDQCTSYNLKYVSNLRNKSRITSLVLDDGSTSQDIDKIKSTFVSFYTSLLGTTHSSPHLGPYRVHNLINRKLTSEQSLAMIAVVRDAEIRDTIMAMNPKKAPGLDGYNSGFFQKAWPIIGHKVTAAIKTFFKSGQLLKKANSTIVALVPKIPNPSKVGNFRPISCCNTIYKCIARILARRLQVALPYLIDPFQSGFVKGRRIADNIFLTQELMKGYHTSSSSPRLCNEG